MVQRQMLRPA